MEGIDIQEESFKVPKKIGNITSPQKRSRYSKPRSHRQGEHLQDALVLAHAGAAHASVALHLQVVAQSTHDLRRCRGSLRSAPALRAAVVGCRERRGGRTPSQSAARARAWGPAQAPESPSGCNPAVRRAGAAYRRPASKSRAPGRAARAARAWCRMPAQKVAVLPVPDCACWMTS